MGKLTKNQKLAAEKIEAGKAYSLKEAASLVKEITFSKFDASLDIDVRLGVDPRKANQMVRGVVSLPLVLVKKCVCWYFVHRMLKLLQKKLVLTMLVLTNILKRSKVDGLILM